MKQKLFSLLFFALALPLCIFGQVSNTGSWPPDFEIVAKCVDSANLGTNYISYYELQTHRAGFTAVIQAYRADGTTFTPPAGTKTIGQCPQSVSITKDSIRDFEVIQLCDKTGTNAYTPFWRMVARTYWPTTGAGTFSVVYTFDKLGASYTPSGSSNISDGPCIVYDYPTTDTRVEITSNQTYNSVMESWSVSNVGTSLITMAVGAGSQVNLYPGETAECNYIVDWDKHTLKLCNTFVVNASGGTAHVWYRTKN